MIKTIFKKICMFPMFYTILLCRIANMWIDGIEYYIKEF